MTRPAPLIGRSNVERDDGDGRSGRTYTWESQSFPSVTTIIGAGVPKPALLPWGIKMVAEAAVEMTESGQLQALVRRTREGALKVLKGAPYDKRDAAGNLGTAVHDAAEAFVLGETRVPDPAVAPFITQYHAFLRDHNPVYLAAECTVFSRKHGYAGTLDGIVSFGELTYLIDYKTAGSGVWPETALQLSAYSHAEFIGMPDGSEEPLPHIDGALALHLRPEAYEIILVRCDDEIFAYFLAAKSIWEWQTQVAKNAIASPPKATKVTK